LTRLGNFLGAAHPYEGSSELPAYRRRPDTGMTSVTAGPKFTEEKFRLAIESCPCGTGFGLSIVKQIVVKIGGEAGFQAAPDGRTIFHVDLPQCVSETMTSIDHADNIRIKDVA